MNLIQKKPDGEGDDLHPNEEIEGEAQGREGEPEEVREPSAPRVPILPSREEVLKHRLTHRPFRVWCPHCIKGKGREDRHLRSSQKGMVPGIPKIVSDYFFIGRRRAKDKAERQQDEEAAEREGQTPILVVKDTSSKSIFSHACPRKGADDLVVKKVIADLEILR